MSQSYIGPMTGNKLYLCCSGCGADPMEIARRTDGAYSEAKTFKYHFDQWLTDHAKCSGKPDHFQLAHQYQPNSDQAPLADPVSNAVRLSLVNGNG